MKIYNSITRKKEEFVPLHKGKVGIYVCGSTVYDFIHIGNARPLVIFDVLRRYLESVGYEVTFVQNFTDIDDKMIARANEEGVTVRELAKRFIGEYYTDAEGLGVRAATVQPRATEHIPQIIMLIEKLIVKGLAYEQDGSVYYRVHSFPRYGCLCGQKLEDLESGARVDVNEMKEDPLDFALWKAQKPGEPAWGSPWGKGRPGWHIECSAMSMEYLGETFDIHGGGVDLLFPHHENEIAQSEGATGQPYVRYWMHNGYISINNEKMSKSKGNFFTVREISEEFDLEEVRMFLLSAHYRSPVNFSRELVRQAASALERLYSARDQLKFLRQSAENRDTGAAGKRFIQETDKAVVKFDAAMEDDLNTADAIGALFELAREIFKLPPSGTSVKALDKAEQAMLYMTDILGLLMKKADDITPEVSKMLKEREAARREKNWKRSDELRDAIQDAGYILEDTAAGQKVRKRV